MFYTTVVRVLLFIYVITTGAEDQSFCIRDSTNDFMISIFGQKGIVSYIHPDLFDHTFSFTVNDTWPTDRTQPLYHSTGDITLRIRSANSTDVYMTFSTTDAYQGPARVISVVDSLIAYDMTSLLAPGHGLNITRIYRQANDNNGSFIIQINLTNTQSYAQQLGALGMSMVFNNDWTKLDLNATAQHCSFIEPYIGQDGAWVKVTRISGEGHILLVLPKEQGEMNVWRPLSTNPKRHGGTFEGFYEYTFLADAYRTNEWSEVPDEQLWTSTNSIILQPGASIIYGLRMRLLANVRDVENELARQSHSMYCLVGIR